jgi:small subunit ribosomal protein S6
LKFAACDILAQVMSEAYELVVITKGDLDDTGHKKQVDEIRKSIEAEKGEALNVDEWGRKELAYPIKKQTHGHYALLTFSADPKTPNNLTKKLRLMEDLLRYMVVRKEDGKAKTQTKPASKVESKAKKK